MPRAFPKTSVMADIGVLLRPRIMPLFKRGLSRSLAGGRSRLLVLGASGAAFWCGLFAAARRVLLHFRGVEEIGDILALKLLSMILIVCFALLLFSSILTSLSKLYLSRDLLLVHSLPVARHRLFLARWLDSTVDSGWMVVLFTLPVFLAYGLVFDAGPAYYGATLFSLAALALIASAVSALAVMVGVILVPAGRMRSIVVVLGVVLFVTLYVAIRLSRPEQLVNPEVFESVLAYVAALQAPVSPLLPSTWAYDSIRSALAGAAASSLFHAALAGSGALALVCLLAVSAEALYFKGFSRTQVAAARVFRGRGISERLLRFLPGPARAFTVKEIKSFLRDQAQWSQLFLIAALVVIYIYNFEALPLERSPIQTLYLQNLLSFLNMALALFVLTAVTARFAYGPSFSSSFSSTACRCWC